MPVPQESTERQGLMRAPGEFSGFAANSACPEWLRSVPAAQLRLAVIVGCMAFWAAVGMSVVSAI